EHQGPQAHARGKIRLRGQESRRPSHQRTAQIHCAQEGREAFLTGASSRSGLRFFFVARSDATAVATSRGYDRAPHNSTAPSAASTISITTNVTSRLPLAGWPPATRRSKPFAMSSQQCRQPSE